MQLIVESFLINFFTFRIDKIILCLYNKSEAQI